MMHAQKANGEVDSPLDLQVNTIMHALPVTRALAVGEVKITVSH